MELVEGPTLQDRIRQGAIPLDEAIAIARQIADALEAAHTKGITHRDLKPANVNAGDAVELFHSPGVRAGRFAGGQYDATRDGQRFLLFEPTEANAAKLPGDSRGVELAESAAGTDGCDWSAVGLVGRLQHRFR